MSFRLCSLVMFTAVVVAVGCERLTPSSTAPSNSSGLSPMASMPAPAATAALKDHLERIVNVDDACDPETFNAPDAAGPGACVRSGGVRFDTFLDQLRNHGSIGAWHFSPPSMTLHAGDRFLAINRGGEVHTFTEVDEFAGGIVQPLNDILGLTTVATECRALGSEDFIQPGATFREDEEEGEHPGLVKYQCCIHPWMKLEARVLDK